MDNLLTKTKVARSEYMRVPLAELKFLAGLTDIFKALGLSNLVMEYEAKLIGDELKRRELVERGFEV